jgi:hypothetical protein
MSDHDKNLYVVYTESNGMCHYMKQEDLRECGDCVQALMEYDVVSWIRVSEQVPGGRDLLTVQRA